LIAVAIENLRNYKAQEELSIKDELTGTYNRRHFQNIILEELTRSRRYHIPLSLCMLDIDYFKNFNDDFGHLVGDQILRQTTALINKSLRISDKLFRYGGEEFAILLVSTNLDKACSVADRLIKAIRKGNVYQVSQEMTVPITVSIGLASFPTDAVDVSGLIEAADKALYVAKDSGKNRCAVYSTLGI
jgi:diguanylate cyclase (GGDEF)-like protein